MTRRRHIACIALILAASFSGSARAALGPAERGTLQRYLQAIAAAKYDVAFAALTPDERTYFGTSANYASVFAADRLKLHSFTIVGSKSDKLGTVALVSERVEFFDARHQATADATVKVAYGLVKTSGGVKIKDPFHPWRALAPADETGTVNGVTVTVRKLSFYTGRMEMVATFANRGDATVTILAYGRHRGAR